MRVVKGQDGTVLKTMLVGKLTMWVSPLHLCEMSRDALHPSLKRQFEGGLRITTEGWHRNPSHCSGQQFKIGFFTLYLLDVVGHCVIMTSISRTSSRPGKIFPGRQKQVWVCLVISILISLGICQPLGYECQLRGATTQTEFCSHPVSEGTILFGNKSLSLHLCPHFFIVPIFCCPFHLVLYWESLERASQTSSTAWSAWEKKKPHSQGSAQEKTMDTVWSPSPASQHGPTATATPTSPENMQGKRAIPLCQMKSRATYSGSEEVGKCWVSAVRK